MVLNPREAFMREYVPAERELSSEEGWLYEYFEKIAKEGKLKMEEFVDVYGDLEIERDKKKLLESKEKYGDSERHERATLLEWVIYDQGERSNWLGEEALTYLASEYDDVRNGVDLVVEWPVGEKEKEWRRLAVDVTMSEMAVGEKLRQIKELLKSDRLARVKYFESDAEEYKGTLINLPKVVVGMDGQAWALVAPKLAETLKQGGRRVAVELGDFKKRLLESIVEQADYFKEVGGREEYSQTADYFKKVITESDWSYLDESRDYLDNKVADFIHDTVQGWKETAEK